MAYVLLYSQNFGEGNSLFSETTYYSRDGTGTPSATGAGSALSRRAIRRRRAGQ